VKTSLPNWNIEIGIIFLKEIEREDNKNTQVCADFLSFVSGSRAKLKRAASRQLPTQGTVTVGVESDSASTARHAKIRNPQCPCKGSRNWVVIDIDESILNRRRSSGPLADRETGGSIRVRIRRRNFFPCGRTDEPFASQSTQYLLSSSRSICVSRFWHFSWICLARSFSWRDVILVVVAAASSSSSSSSFLSPLSSPSRANITNHARPRSHGPAAASSPR